MIQKAVVSSGHFSMRRYLFAIVTVIIVGFGTSVYAEITNNKALYMFAMAKASDKYCGTPSQGDAVRALLLASGTRLNANSAQAMKTMNDIIDDLEKNGAPLWCFAYKVTMLTFINKNADRIVSDKSLLIPTLEMREELNKMEGSSVR